MRCFSTARRERSDGTLCCRRATEVLLHVYSPRKPTSRSETGDSVEQTASAARSVEEPQPIYASDKYSAEASPARRMYFARTTAPRTGN